MKWYNSQLDCGVKMFINKLLEWQKAGYVSADVWTDIEELINKNLLPSEDEISGDSMSSVDDRKLNTDTSNGDPPEPDVALAKVSDQGHKRKLQKDDQVTERMLLRVSHHIYPSERRQFAIECLEISAATHDNIIRDNLTAEIRNFKVNYVQHLHGIWKADLFYNYFWLV